MVHTFFGYIWGAIVHPKKTFDELAQLTSIRYAVMAIVLVYLLQYLNFLLFTVFGYDWLGTRRELPDPTYVGLFGRMPIGTEQFMNIFFVIIFPLLGVLGPVVIPGLAQVFSKIWRGQGTFEQMVNTLGFAQAPAGLFAVLINDMILGGVPMNLIVGHPYAFTAAMNGEFGALWSTIVWTYVIGVYSIGLSVWIVTLGTIAIQRVQRIPWWAAALIMTFSYIVWFVGIEGSVVR
jgi:hypothetical protein